MPQGLTGKKGEGRHKKKSIEHKRKISEAHLNLKERHPRWKGGRSIHRGYVLVLAHNHPKKWKHSSYIPEHRLIMEEYLERPLRTDEDVHHVNGIKHDNRIENLQVLSKAEHTKLRYLNYKKKICVRKKCQRFHSAKGLCKKHYAKKYHIKNRKFKPFKFNCVQCYKESLAYQSRSKFCSYSCKLKFHNNLKYLRRKHQIILL